MKLTPRGKDYLKAILAGAIIASILDIKIVLTLCLSIAITAAISGLVLRTSSRKNVQLELENPHLSCFKGDEMTEKVRLILSRSQLVSATISSVQCPDGIDASVDTSHPENLVVRLLPKFARRFSGLIVAFELRDPLQLFSKTIDISNNDFILDCYPAALLTEIRASRPISLALGERTGRTHGTGQEFYSVDEYHVSTEEKNIFWKKVAAMPDERLLVKLRESNIPRTLKIALLQTSDRQQDSLEWMDHACEGTALLGKTILSIGCDVEILFISGREIISRRATDLTELSDAIMLMSISGKSDLEDTPTLLSNSDICVTGFKELQLDLLATTMARKPALLIEDHDAMPKSIGNLSIIFNGSQDVSRLVNSVVGR